MSSLRDPKPQAFSSLSCPVPEVSSRYEEAGVSLGLARQLKSQLFVRSRRQPKDPRCLGELGGFAGLFRARFPGYRKPVLVASTDGVGTKLALATALQKYRGVGQDLVHHCINDIAVVGAKPLFFLDYLGVARLEPRMFQELLGGILTACRRWNCTLLGGETAQLSDTFQPGHFELVGTIVGVVEESQRIDGSKIQPGNILVGLPSHGLHTNGYTLVRKILEKTGFPLTEKPPGFRRPLGEILLAVHRCYLPEIQILRRFQVRGLAHITGGGLPENLLRILPEGMGIELWLQSWPVPRIFSWLLQQGNLSWNEAYTVFNMGIGLVAVLPENQWERCRQTLGRVFLIGRVIRSRRRVVHLVPKKSPEDHHNTMEAEGVEPSSSR
ncbi:phosphoribosylformylglycinamidine cyclo-ligase [Candidatus Methylacidithermus pantelleriae]|uniref:Phosphoribosylformylglycinamidine cyclo-ligase n=1 Tax=Candidatus Methylacidithermus pantelleriae TaxID=2744239 RepID=A0A8J2BRE2_9BACT|nr:phosphoribosylformylglycinamidine cyclo-ligase [Candidatus Methylacidithermus pantelleriae]CAF0704504.1 Phosphoribosylformylglycinamidine cyclo-ligase [Candidatus Methylacidithermus pantelleriae]